MNEALAYWGENLNEKTIKMMRLNGRKWIGDSVSSNAVLFIGLNAFHFVWNRETISSKSQKWNNDQLKKSIFRNSEHWRQWRINERKSVYFRIKRNAKTMKSNQEWELYNFHKPINH